MGSAKGAGLVGGGACTSSASSGAIDACKIFVGGLPQTADENALTTYFSAFGYVTGAEVKRDPLTGNSRGFAFVTYDSPEAVQRVLNCGYSHNIGQKQVEVKQAKAEEQKGQKGGWGKGAKGGFGADLSSAGNTRGLAVSTSSNGMASKTFGIVTPAMRTVLPASSLPPLLAPQSTLQGGGWKGGKGKGKSSKGKGKRPVHEQDEAKIFVVGIPKTSTEEEVRAYFAQFGAVKAVEMLKDHRTGQCRTYCFVTFEDPLVAKAIQSVPGLELGGSILELSSAWPTKEEEAGPGAAQDPGDADATKIFVGGLMRSTQEEEVQQFFSQFGSITEVLLKKDPSTGASRGFGFITFADEASMQRALANYDSNLIGGKWVDVRRAEAAGAASEGKGKGKGKQAAPLALPDAADGRKLFLGGLAHTVTEAEVTAHFSQYGAVEEAVVKRDHEGNARGFGFVTFVEPGGMAMALADYDKHSIGGKWVETRPAGGYKGHSKGAGRPSPY